MKNKALLIEHEPLEINQYTELLECADLDVNVLSNYSKELLSQKLDNNYYDIIITDVFFNHHESSNLYDQKDSYKLGEIVDTIRKKDNQVIIIVNTQFHNRLEIEDDLSNVNYVFDKNLNGDLFVWQIKQIVKNDINQDILENKLVTKLIYLMKHQSNLLWKEDISTMLQRYREGKNEKEKIIAITSNLINLLNKCNFTGANTILLDNISDQELFVTAENPYKFGHLRHVINVFWLGYFIINSNWSITNKIAEELYPNESNIQRLTYLNQAWLVSSLFHDIGKIGEKSESIAKKLNAILSIFSDNTEGKKFFNLDTEHFHFTRFDVVKSKVSGDETELFKEFESGYSILDHGILSCLTVDKHLIGNFKKDSTPFYPALSAIAFHNIFQIKRILLTKFSKKLPLLSFLILCDLIELWDRETVYDNSLTSDIERIELENIIIDNDQLNIEINYKINRNILNNNSFIRIEKKLKEILDNSVIPILQELGLDHLNEKLKITFTLNSSENKIHEWPSI